MDSNKKIEKLENELNKQDEIKNKKLMLAMWTIVISNMLFFLEVIFLATTFLEEGPLLATIIISSMVIFLMACFIALKFEVDAGYYECKRCNHKFVPTYSEAVWAAHIFTTRYLKCPECNKKSWCKKVLNKE